MAAQSKILPCYPGLHQRRVPGPDRAWCPVGGVAQPGHAPLLLAQGEQKIFHPAVKIFAVH